MTSQIGGDAVRLELLRRLQEEDRGPPPAAVAQAEQVLAAHQEVRRKRRERILRLSMPLPQPDLCPICWSVGESALLEDQPTQDKGEWLRCSRCGHVQLQRP